MKRTITVILCLIMVLEIIPIGYVHAEGESTSSTGAMDENLNDSAELQGFSDVPGTSYYSDAVNWAVNMGVTGGTSATTFDPGKTVSRAEFVTFLWGYGGRPEPKTTNNPFSDVKSSDWFYKAVLWAVENNLTAGTTKTTFSPKAKCTRAQVITFIYACAGRPEDYMNSFSDVTKGMYYYDAVRWGQKKGLYSNWSSIITQENRFSTIKEWAEKKITMFFLRRTSLQPTLRVRVL